MCEIYIYWFESLYRRQAHDALLFTANSTLSMKRISTLALVAAVGLFQTGCFNSTADNNQPQEAQAAAIAAPATAQPAAAPVAAPAAPVQAAVPVAAVPGAIAPAAIAPAAIAPAAVAPAAVSPAPVAAAPAALQVNANTFFVSTNDGTALNVRSTNSTQSQVIGSLPQGSQVLMHISDRSGEWFEVSGAGVRGWVAAAYLIDPNGYRAAGSVPAKAAPAPAPAPRSNDNNDYGEEYGDYYDLQIQTMDGDSLNLRSGPTTEAGVIRAVPHGGSLIYLDEVGRWTQVQTPDGVVGYVASDYLIYR